jgi:DnaJ domain
MVRAARDLRHGICAALPVRSIEAAGSKHMLQPWSARTGARLLRHRESLSRLGAAPILSLMRRQPTDPVFAAEPEPPVRACEHPGCPGGGEFRAPKSRLELDRYYWFCLEHVRAYNSAWNYYAGMNDSEIEAEIRHDTVWQRPSWKLGERHTPGYAERMRDPFGFYSGKAHSNGAHRSNGRANGHNGEAAARAASAREQALAVFDLEPPFTVVRLKARYKVLVKMHHPDAHGGDKAAEERLKIINQAYATLKASYS